MKRLSWFLVVSSFRYPNLSLKIPAAFVSSNLIILYEERPALKIILTTPAYYVALLVNMLMAYLLIALVVRITRLLDYHYPWNRSHRLRLRAQIIGGVLFPIIPSFIMASLYFMAYGINIFHTVYLSRYLQQIIFMLFLLNAFLFYYWHQKNKDKPITRSLLSQHNINVNSANIAMLYAEDKHYFSYNFKGEKEIWPHSLSKSWNYLSATEFVTINRSYIVNRRAILNVVVGKKINVKLIQPLNLDLIVSQRETVTFKKWWLHKIS